MPLRFHALPHSVHADYDQWLHAYQAYTNGFAADSGSELTDSRTSASDARAVTYLLALR